MTASLLSDPIPDLNATQWMHDHGALILQSVGTALWIVDAQGRTMFVNPAAAECVGWQPDELLGKSQHEVLRHADRQAVPYEQENCPLCRCLHAGTPYEASEDVFYRKDGTSFPAGCHSAPILENGTVKGAVLSFKNISQRRLMQAQLVQAQKLESIGQLAAGIAHEINTPIQFVGDNTRFLKDAVADLFRMIAVARRLTLAGQPAPELAAACEELQKTAAAADIDYLCDEIPRSIDQSLEGISRVTKIVRSLKDFSHPDSDCKAPADLNKAIESTVTVARNEWKYVAEMELELDSGLPLVHCLAGALNQVILNLVVNAAHAIADARTAGSEGKGKISISTRQEGELVCIRIRDTGAGIPAAIREKIFDPFFTTKPVGKGTGQGLAIAYSVVVEKHGGTIGFESEMGRGTTFTIRLPINSQPQPARDQT